MVTWFLLNFGYTHLKILIGAFEFDSIIFYFLNIEGTGVKTIMKTR